MSALRAAIGSVMDLRIEFERVGDSWRAWAPDFGTSASGPDPASAMRACETETLRAIAGRRERGEPIPIGGRR